jgi:starvation-inducible DNA-binding protein
MALQTHTTDTKTKRSAKGAKGNGNGGNGKGHAAPSLAQPLIHQRAREIQPYSSLVNLPLALDRKARLETVAILNQVLADTMTLRDLYKKHHWQVSGATFYQLHLLYDKHHDEQVKLVDAIAERIQTLGGISIAMAPDVAEMTQIPRPPRGREEVPVQISRLLEAHEMLLQQTRRDADKTALLGDQGSNDLLVSEVLRTNEMQVWFLSQHLVNAPLTEAR